MQYLLNRKIMDKKNYKPEIGYQLTLLFDVAILAVLASTILHYISEANSFAKFYLLYGGITNSTTLQFDTIACATINFQIVYATLISGIVATVPIIIIGACWTYNKMDLDLRKLMIFPAIAITIHLVHLHLFAMSSFKEYNCIIQI